MRTWNRIPISLLLVLLLSSPMAFGQARSEQVVLAEGTAIQVRLTDRISSERNRSGDNFEAVLDEDLHSQGRVVARIGDEVTGRLVRVQQQDRSASIELTLTELRTGDARYPLDTNNIEVRAEPDADRQKGLIGGGAGVGAIIGAIAGGLRGAVIGAAVGAGAGATAVLVTEGEQVVFEPEQQFLFHLSEEMSLPLQAGAPQADQSRPDQSREQPESQPQTFGSSPDRQHNQAGAPGATQEQAQPTAEGRQMADQLQSAAQRLWDSVRQDPQMGTAQTRPDDRFVAERESEDVIRLYMALSNFANSAELFSELARRPQAHDLRGGAISLVYQAENIDRILARLNASPTVEQGWSEVQREIAQIGDSYNLGYAYSPAAREGRAE
jgi:hypothetical protein